MFYLYCLRKFLFVWLRYRRRGKEGGLFVQRTEVAGPSYMAENCLLFISMRLSVSDEIYQSS